MVSLAAALLVTVSPVMAFLLLRGILSSATAATP
jgi:hypothetical protein